MDSILIRDLEYACKDSSAFIALIWLMFGLNSNTSLAEEHTPPLLSRCYSAVLRAQLKRNKNTKWRQYSKMKQASALHLTVDDFCHRLRTQRRIGSVVAIGLCSKGLNQGRRLVVLRYLFEYVLKGKLIIFTSPECQGFVFLPQQILDCPALVGSSPQDYLKVHQQ